MFRLFVMPMIIGVLAFLCTWLILPLIFKDPGIVSIVASYAVDFSNSNFDTMPPVIASYVANLTPVLIAVTVAIVAMAVVQLLLLFAIFISCSKQWISWCLLKFEKKEEPRDLPPLEMDSSFKPSKIGQGVVGRGLDSIDRD